MADEKLGSVVATTQPMTGRFNGGFEFETKVQLQFRFNMVSEHELAFWSKFQSNTKLANLDQLPILIIIQFDFGYIIKPNVGDMLSLETRGQLLILIVLYSKSET
jgi:hypothetical protein